MKRLGLVLFSIALLLRIVFGVVFLPEAYRHPSGDAGEYEEMARNLISGRGLTDGASYSQRTPGYPLFLAAVYLLFGKRPAAVRVVQAVLGALLCVLVLWSARALFSKSVGILAGFLSAVYPPFIRFAYYGGPGFLLSENLQIFLLGLVVLAASVLVTGERGWGIFALLGFFLGLCLLTRPDAVFLAILAPLWVIAISKGVFRERVLRGLFVVGLAFVTVLPWGVRNALLHGEPVFLSTKSGATFFDGNNPQARGGGVWVHGDPAYHPDHFETFSEVEKDRFFLKRGLHFLRTHPERIPWLFIRKIFVHWSPWVQTDSRRIYQGSYVVLAPFAAMGLYVLIKNKKWKVLSLFALLFLATTLPAIIAFGDPRYRYPYEPYGVMLAAAGLMAAGERFRKTCLMERRG